MKLAWLTVVVLLWSAGSVAHAEIPSVSYIFPAGGQRGTTVDFKVGGHYLYESCPFEMRGPGVEASRKIDLTETIWFEGPVIPKPASQAAENYPSDYKGKVTIAADASLGARNWYVWTAQGVTPRRKFVVGDLREIIEDEIDGNPIPTKVNLPLTINGRIFPREDVDIWTFDAKAGQTVTCEVCAARLGSPLDSRLEIRDSSGRRIAENIDAIGIDSRLHFTAPRDGLYAVHIHDVKFGGLQHYVYRLMITAGPYLESVYPLGGKRGSMVKLKLLGSNLPVDPQSVSLPADNKNAHMPYRARVGNQQSNPVLFELDDLTEYLEEDVTAGKPVERRIAIPAVLNGRVSKPGEVDTWSFEAQKGADWEFDLRASRLGSPLDSVLTVVDSAGKQIATNDDIAGGQTDSKLSVKIPADGVYTAGVQDRLSSRGGPRFAYRLRITPVAPVADFRLLLPVGTLNVERKKTVEKTDNKTDKKTAEKTVKLKFTVERTGGFQGPIELTFDNIPKDVTVTGTTIAEKKNETEVSFKASETAKIQMTRVVVSGKAKIGDRDVIRRAFLKTLRGEPKVDSLLLATTLATPFRIRGLFEQKFVARGSVYVRHYKLERNGFKGPIEISLSERHVRHRQGITGPKLVFGPEVTEFDYPLQLSPFMEVGRTSRTNLAVVGVVADPDGSKHKVSFTTFDVNEQFITLTDPGRISVSVRHRSLRAKAGASLRVGLDVDRANGLNGAMKIELIVPPHIRGVSGDPVKIPADSKTGELVIRFSPSEPLGPFNMPVTVRATMNDERGHRIIAQTSLIVVPAK